MLETETITVALSRPILAHNESLSRLDLRCPTVKELRQCGAPYQDVATRVPNYEACARLISMICAIPTSSVDQLDAKDFTEASMILVGFTFAGSALPTLMNSPTEPSRPPASGDSTPSA